MFPSNDNLLNNDIEFLDILSIISFVIGLKNYMESLNQGDKQEILHDFNKNTDALLRQINSHLEEQDEKINKILKKLEIKE